MISKHVSLLVLYLFSSLVYSSQFNMTLETNRIGYDSFNKIGEYYAPSLWDFALNIPTTLKWSPNLPSTSEHRTITLISDLSSAEIRYTLKGFQFHIGSTSQQSTNVGNSCLDGNILSLYQGVCSDEVLVYELSSIASPFVSLRPIIEFDEQEIRSIFETKPDGIYFATAQVDASFDFYIGDVRSRRVYPTTIEFLVENSTDEIVNVQIISGNGQFYPRYGLNNNYVTGDTEYRLQVSGKISNGLKIGPSNVRNNYVLTSFDGTEEIPYSVSCRQCDTTELIVDGNIVNQEARLNSGSVSDNIYFDLNFLVQDVDISSFSNNQFYDNFQLLVELEL